jgi:uncharacterized membrane protein
VRELGEGILTYTIIAVSVAVAAAGVLLAFVLRARGRNGPVEHPRTRIETIRGEALVLASAAVATGVALSPAPVPIRVAFAAPLALFLPGLAVGNALFASTIPWIERITVSIALSLGVCVVGGFALHWTPTGLTAASWVGVLLATTMVGVVIPRRRPAAQDPEVRPRSAPWLSTHGRLLVAVPVAVVVLALAVVLARTPLPAKGVRGYTALWLVPVENQRDAVHIGVESAELETTPYRLELRVAGQLTLTRLLTLRTGAEWSAVVDASPIASGQRSFEALLYRANEAQSPYRRATLVFPGATVPPATAVWLNQARPERNAVRVVVTSAERRATSFRLELRAAGRRVRVLPLTLSPGERRAMVVDLGEVAGINPSIEALLYRKGEYAPRPPYRKAKLILGE